MSCAHNHASKAYPELGLGSNAAKWQKNLTQDRLNQFTDGRYSSMNLSSVLYVDRRDDQEHVQMAVWSAPERTKPLFEEAMKQKFKPAKKGDSFGPSCACSRRVCLNAIIDRVQGYEPSWPTCTGAH